ncbi:hypothetical protein LTR08_004278 [Meristemomyces frigidus]|nr:hypothetical protein LTR08_004278 [Meristemomyces frigidus]
MSSGLMETDAGGENQQYAFSSPFASYRDQSTDTDPRYEGNLGLVDEHKKSGGQMGSAETTTDSSDTPEGKQQKTDRGEKTAENIRYGQGISEGGMGGMTQGSSGSAEQEGYGKQEDGAENVDESQARRAQGYGGGGGEGRDMDPNIGA